MRNRFLCLMLLLAAGCGPLKTHPPIVTSDVIVDTPAIDVTCPLFTDLSSVWSTLPWWTEAQARLPALGQAPLPLDADAAEGAD